MPTPEQSPPCVVAESLVVPRLNRIEQSLSTGQEKFLDHDLRMRALSLVHDEHNRRITLLEHWMAEQQAESRAGRLAVESVANGLSSLTNEVRSNANTIGAALAEIKSFFLSHAADVARDAEEHRRRSKQELDEDRRRNDEAMKRHRALMMVGMTLAFSVAGLVAVLGALHGVFSGVPLAESLAAMLARLKL